jgi:hypothetical protein
MPTSTAIRRLVIPSTADSTIPSHSRKRCGRLCCAMPTRDTLKRRSRARPDSSRSAIEHDFQPAAHRPRPPPPPRGALGGRSAPTHACDDHLAQQGLATCRRWGGAWDQDYCGLKGCERNGRSLGDRCGR